MLLLLPIYGKEMMVKQPMGIPGKSACLKAMARGKKTRRTSRLHQTHLLMVRSLRMSSLFNASAP